jgi:two-component system alkaline phosphatase synthesis response regulator PhoP
VVDDDPDIYQIVEANLAAAGYDVRGACDGIEGLRLAREYAPDIVVLDVLMPEMDGWEVLRQIESDQELAGLPVVMLTCRSEDSDILRGLEQGAVEYITKPFYPEDLVASITITLSVFDAALRDERRRQLIARRRRLMGAGQLTD